jgi:glutamate--cysteine ligase
MIGGPTFDRFVRSVRERLFVPQADDRRRIGLEIELLPMLADSARPCPLERGDDARSTLGFLRPYGFAAGWREHRSAKGAPYFGLPNGWTLTFEPGGQIELCTTPSASVSALAREASDVLTRLRGAAGDAGIDLLSVGIDPVNDISSVPLQLESPRYVAMTRYFERIGPSGVRMMRQTAATQVSVDAGREPEDRWRFLSDLTPYLTALFANSTRYLGEESGFQSFRAHCWRSLDASRTGVPHPELTACEGYARFALDAFDMTRTDERGEYRSFADWVLAGHGDAAEWENHLTTLFPEVRPRGHLEVRSLDALPPEEIIAPAVLIAGLTYDARAAAEARHVVPMIQADMLNRAARCGLYDSEIASVATELVRIALRGAAALGENFVTAADVERAGELTLTRLRATPTSVAASS